MTPRTSSATDARRGAAQRASGRAGFVMMELMLALAIVALLAALALPRGRPFDGGAALRAKAYETAALIRADRDAARRLNKEVASVVDFGRRRVAAGSQRRTVDFPEAIAMRLKGDRFAGFRFFPDGRSSGGELMLDAGGRRLVLKVDRLTSAVEIRAP